MTILILSPFAFTGQEVRYLTVPFIGGLSITMYDILNFIENHNFKRLTTALVLLAVLIPLRMSSDLKTYRMIKDYSCASCIQQLQTVCDHFNKENIPFEDVYNNTFEITDNAESSLYSAKDCFNKIHGKSASTKRYLFIATSKSDIDLTSLPKELREISDLSKLQTELKTSGFTMYSFPKKPSDQFHVRLSNLANPYEIDPALGKGYALTSDKKTPITHIAKVCDIPVFCDIYISSQFKEGKLDLTIRSRLLQTKYDLPPYSARLEDVQIQFMCDSKLEKMYLVSSLGTDNRENQNKTFSSPLEISSPLRCQHIQLISLSTSRMTLASAVDRRIANDLTLPLENILQR